jgi:hypothetical protein
VLIPVLILPDLQAPAREDSAVLIHDHFSDFARRILNELHVDVGRAKEEPVSDTR